MEHARITGTTGCPACSSRPLLFFFSFSFSFFRFFLFFSTVSFSFFRFFFNSSPPSPSLPFSFFPLLLLLFLLFFFFFCAFVAKDLHFVGNHKNKRCWPRSRMSPLVFLRALSSSSPPRRPYLLTAARRGAIVCRTHRAPPPNNISRVSAGARAARCRRTLCPANALQPGRGHAPARPSPAARRPDTHAQQAGRRRGR